MHTRAMELPTPAGLEAFIGVCHSIQWVAFERRWIGSGMDWARGLNGNMYEPQARLHWVCAGR